MENEAITLSIIIPVYNSSRFLDECLSSLEKQTALSSQPNKEKHSADGENSFVSNIKYLFIK